MKSYILLMFVMPLASAVNGVSERNVASEDSPFVCRERGKFPIPGECQKYYQCRNPSLHGPSPRVRQCINGTMFDVSKRKCEQISVVVPSHPNCLINETQPTGFSAMLTAMIRDNEEVCHHINTIDDFETAVIGSLDLREQPAYQKKINGYITSYNRDLNVAKDQVGPWRKGDDIVSAMRRIYYKAKAYESDFDSKKNIYESRLQSLPDQVKSQEERLRESIDSKNVQIRALEQSLEKAGVENINEYLENRKATLENEVEQKERELLNLSASSLQLEELVAVLGFLRDDPTDIVDRSKKTQRIMSEFYENVSNATKTFSTYGASAQRDIESLGEEAKQLERDLVNKKKDIEDLKERKHLLEEDERSFSKELDVARKRAKDLLIRITDEKLSFGIRRNLTCKEESTGMLFAKLVGIADDKLCEHALKSRKVVYKAEDDEKEHALVMENITKLTRKITDLLPQYNTIDQDIRTIEDSISPINIRKSQISYEVRQFTLFKNDVVALVDRMESVLPNISSATKGIEGAESVFTYIKEQLSAMIEQAKAPKNESERQQAIDNISQDLSELQRQLDQSSQLITDVGSC